MVLALLPITNPTSTALFKSIVAIKTRNAVVFRPSRARRAARAARVEIIQDAGAEAGTPAGRGGGDPDATHNVSQYLFHHDDVKPDLTTGGPSAVQASGNGSRRRGRQLPSTCTRAPTWR